MVMAAMVMAVLARAQEKAASAIPIAKLARTSAVDFESEVLPIFRTSCLACHNRTTTKGGLVLETPKTILAGGDDGPAVVPGKSGESALLRSAAHLEKPFMPPHDNKAKAPNLTSEQLALVKLWIDQGAKGEVHAATIHWRPLPASFTPAYAVALTPDGQFAAIGRGNRLDVYELAKKVVLSPFLAGHRDMVYSLAMSRDGQALASGSFGEVKIWRRAAPTSRFAVHVDALITAMAASADGQRVAVATNDGKLQLAGGDGKAIKMIATTQPVRAMRFSPDGGRLVCAGRKKIEVRNAADGGILAEVGTASEVACAAWVGAEKVAVGGADGVIRIYTVLSAAPAKLSLFKELAGNAGAVAAIDPLGAGQLVCGSADGSIRMWDVEKGQAIRQVSHGAAVTAVAGRGDGKAFASAGENGVVKLWDAEKGALIAEIKGEPALLRIVGEREDALKLATADVAFEKSVLQKAQADHKVQEERIKKALEAKTATTRPVAEKTEIVRKGALAKGKADAALLSATGDPKRAQEVLTEAKELASAVIALKAAQLAQSNASNELDLANAALERSDSAIAVSNKAISAAEAMEKTAQGALASAKQAAGVVRPVRRLAFSSDGSTLASAGDEQAIQLWNGQTGAAMRSIGAAGGHGLAFAGEATRILAAGERAVTLWDAAPRWVLERTIGSASADSPLSDRVNALAFSPDGRILAAGAGEPSRGGQIALWEVQSGRLLHDYRDVHSDAVLALDFSRDGGRLASGGADRFVKVLDLATHKVVLSLEGHTHHVLGVSFKADGRVLASGGADGQVKVWDLVAGEKKGNIPPGSGEVTAISFMGITDQMIVTGADGQVRIMNSGGGVAKTLANPTDHIHAAALSGDGKTFVCGGQSGNLYVWDLAGGKLVATLAPGKAP
jgi:WD40 repeat protein